MFEVDKESLLNLNDAMRKTIEEMDYDNPLELSAFAGTMISMGNQINMNLIRDVLDNRGDD